MKRETERKKTDRKWRERLSKKIIENKAKNWGIILEVQFHQYNV